MENWAAKAKRYLDLAEKAHVKARIMKSPEAAETLDRVGRDYERLAEHALEQAREK